MLMEFVVVVDVEQKGMSGKSAVEKEVTESIRALTCVRTASIEMKGGSGARRTNNDAPSIS